MPRWYYEAAAARNMRAAIETPARCIGPLTPH
jgi:hypothetical protein